MQAGLTQGQGEFLAMAERRGVDTKLFGEYVPEIKFQEEEPDPTKPTIAYIHTGGTLMMVPSKSDPGKLSFDGAIDIAEVMKVCELIAGVRSRYNVIGIYLANIDSKEMIPKVWTATSAAIKTVYDDVEGVTVGHGTHAIEHAAAGTAYALQRLGIPIVYTASQIPIIGYPGSDGLPNLTGAMEIAAHGDVAEVLAYAHGEIHRGTRVSKKHDHRIVELFEPKVTGPQGYFGAGGSDFNPGTRRRGASPKYGPVMAPHFSESISIMKAHPGMPRQLREADSDVALVLETFGSAAIPNGLIPVLKERIDRGFPVYLTSSAGASGVSRSMEQHDEDAVRVQQAGIRHSYDMTTTATVVKLMHILGNMPGVDLETLHREMTERSYGGEITLMDPVKADY